MDEFPTISSPPGDPGVNQLDRLSDEQFWEYARTLANRASPTPLAQEYLECFLSNGCCLVPLAALDEVVLSPSRFTFLPAAPHWMAGLAAWHGETIAVVDLDVYLSQHSVSRRAVDGMVLIAHDAYTTLGLLVSVVGRAIPMDVVASASDSDLSRLPTWCLPSRSTCVKGMLADTVVLDIPLLIAEAVKEIEIITPYG
jgi:chemotaxis signal transduction protein